jgi:phosphate-selective porin OprO/OprP
MGRRVVASVSALWIGLAVGAAPLAAQPPAADPLRARLTALEAEVRAQRQRIGELESRLSGEAMAAAFQEKLDALRNELKAEMAAAGAARGDLDFRVYWSDGLRLETRDKSVKLKIGGRLMYDVAFFDDTGMTDSAEVRRGRLYFAGTMGKHCEFKMQFDFVGGDADLKDAYLRFRNIPVVGNITLGHFDEPFGLEQCTSTKYITFMERALPFEAFSPCSNWGVKLHNTALDGRVTWQVGLFADTDDYGTWTGEDRYALTGHLTGLPVYEDEGRRLVHVGFSYSYRAVGGAVRYRSRPEAHLAPRLVDTGSIAADNASLFGGEAAVVLGSFSFQAEYMGAIAGTGERNLCFSGFYTQASYLLTGEHRPYSKPSGSFGRVKPLRPFCNGEGPGAWEVAARYSYVDLNDGGVGGGRLRDYTLGINWYLNNNVRLMWNYVCAQVARSGLDETAHILQMRVQVDF